MKAFTTKFQSFAINLMLAVAMLSGQAISAERGKIIGGAVHQAPSWFKESFLEIVDDVEEASEEGKHLLLFFQLNACPYCDRMLEESFEAEPLTSYIQEHFDTIAINVRGDRDIAFNEETSVSEKQLADILNVRATPAILFLNEENKTIVRVNGYRAPERFQQVLEYVATKSYQSTNLSDYLQAKLKRDVYQLRSNELFAKTNDLSQVDDPMMLIFEDGSCYDCNEFHDGILGHKLVRKEIEPFTIVRLDADSDKTIIDLHGNKTTAAELAREYEMIYRPGILVFDEGNLIRRHDSLTFPHHFKESMRYVAGGYYKNTDYRSYSQNRTEELLAAGIDIDLGRP
ncbi:MAG: thioredoxin fold domain-containing protein [Gammaproteobacteria bacterium]|nr:thioredoxin fold domain-containing protein [Gammaproteobacteria bacterium]